MQGAGGEWGVPGENDPELDDWGDREWDDMSRAAAAAQDAAFWQVPPEPVAHVTAAASAAHLRRQKPRFRDAFREHPWHAVKDVVTAKGTLAAVGGVAAAAVFVVVAIAAFAGNGTSDDVTTVDDARGTKDSDEERGFGDKTREEDGTTSTLADTTTAPSSSTTESSTTTSTPEDDDDQGDDDGDDDGDDPPVVPATVPDTEPPAATTTAPTTTTTTRPLAQPAIDSFAVDLDSWCSRDNGTVEATFRWSSRNGTSATLTSSSPGQQPLTVNLAEDDFDICPRPGDRVTLRVTGQPGTTPATRTLTVPGLAN